MWKEALLVGCRKHSEAINAFTEASVMNTHSFEARLNDKNHYDSQCGTFQGYQLNTPLSLMRLVEQRKMSPVFEVYLK